MPELKELKGECNLCHSKYKTKGKRSFLDHCKNCDGLLSVFFEEKETKKV